MKKIHLTLFLLCPLIVLGQVFKGTVKNTKNETLANINVALKGTAVNTITNESGQFSLQATSKTATLIFSAIGYQTMEVNMTESQSTTVIISLKTGKLDEIQIVAYGTNTQRYNVGSVTKVTAEDISNQAVTNPLQALQGRVPGLVVTSTSGLPGASLTVQIRGQNTLKPSSSIVAPQDNPLFIIDGVPFGPQNGNVNQFNSVAAPGAGNVYNDPYGGMSPFNSIDPSNIESIEVLRDADATAIYGSRGGNGVILITTKKGKAGKTEFNMNVNMGISFLGKTTPLMNTQQYLSMRREAFANDKITPNLIYGDPGYAPDLLAFDTTRYTNWKQVFFGNIAHTDNAAASVSGGTESTQFRIGGSFTRNSYIFPGDLADSRSGLTAQIHHASPNKKFTLDFSSGYSYDNNNSSAAPSLLLASRLEPDFPALLDDKGNLIWSYNGIQFDGAYEGFNPFAYLKQQYTIQNNSLTSNLLLTYKIVTGLTLRTSLGYNTFNSDEYSATPAASQFPGYNPTAYASFGKNDFTTWIIEPQAEYKSTFKKMAYSILFGSTFQKSTNSKLEADGTGYINDALIGSISGAPITSASDAYSEYKYSAIFSRFSLKWDDKYLLNLNARRDGSSRFGPDRQFGNFGSVGAGWLFNEEPFIKNNIPLLSYGKLRGSYGITGSDNISDYQYFARWGPTTYAYNGQPGYSPQNLYNPDLSWASTQKLEFGFELGFLNDKILFNSTWFRNRTGNQLLTYQLPSQTGFTTVYENWGAVVENSGWEFTLQFSPAKNPWFSWNSSINLTVPENKLVSFPGIENSSYSVTYFVGQSLSTVKGFRSAGVDPATGLFQFINAAGQLTGTPASASGGKLNDAAIIGNTDPKFYGGWQNTFSCKGFQLDLFIDFKKQRGYNYLRAVYTSLPGLEFNQPLLVQDRWTTPGQQATLSRYSTQYGTVYSNGSSFNQSDGVYGDASYIKLRSASLSYNFSTKLLERYKVRNLKLYATGQNLLTITRYQGSDPETQSIYGVPPLRAITFGLNLTL
jgi:TonB-linked SusC/RagA family outer membrane protein